MCSSDVVLGGNRVASSRCVSLEGGGVIEGALLSARDVGEEGSSATSLNPSRYIEIASSTLMPPSIPQGASGVSGDRSVIELLFVRTLLRSVPEVCSMLDREVIAELKLARRVLSSAGPFDGNRGNGRPWAPVSWLPSGDTCGRGRPLCSREVDMEMRRPPLAGGALRWLGRSKSLSREYHIGGVRSGGGVKGGA